MGEAASQQLGGLDFAILFEPVGEHVGAESVNAVERKTLIGPAKSNGIAMASPRPPFPAQRHPVTHDAAKSSGFFNHQNNSSYTGMAANELHAAPWLK